MPYIQQIDRAIRFDEPMHDPGALNFYITKIILSYLGFAPKYKDFNEVIGVLECVKLEMYRRAVVPYEDKKREENGDVY